MLNGPCDFGSSQKQYLLGSLQSVVQQKHARGSASLLATHIRLMLQLINGDSMGPAKILETARRYSAKRPKCAHVWVARLEAEKQIGLLSEGREVVDKAWAEARRAVEGSQEEIEKVWLWGVFRESSGAERLKIHEVCQYFFFHLQMCVIAEESWTRNC